VFSIKYWVFSINTEIKAGIKNRNCGKIDGVKSIIDEFSTKEKISNETPLSIN
jgi:hypothetical protein